MFKRESEGVSTTQGKLLENIIHDELQSNTRRYIPLRKEQIGGYLYVNRDQIYGFRMQKNRARKDSIPRQKL